MELLCHFKMGRDFPNGERITFPYEIVHEIKGEELMNELNNLLVGIPDGVANLELPDPGLRQYYLDEKDRIFWVDSQIDESTLDLVKMIIKCNREDAGKPVEDRQPIKVMIDSCGGSVEVLASIIGAIKISKTPIWTCVYCTAYSAAGDLLACGHRRFALPMTSVMFHTGSACYQGSQNDIDKAKKFYDSMCKRVIDEVNSRTKFDKKFLKNLKTDDMYMNEEEALQYGVVDTVIEDMEVLFN